jgi:hypothetical protein
MSQKAVDIGCRMKNGQTVIIEFGDDVEMQPDGNEIAPEMVEESIINTDPDAGCRMVISDTPEDCGFDDSPAIDSVGELVLLIGEIYDVPAPRVVRAIEDNVVGKQLFQSQ